MQNMQRPLLVKCRYTATVIFELLPQPAKAIAGPVIEQELLMLGDKLLVLDHLDRCPAAQAFWPVTWSMPPLSLVNMTSVWSATFIASKAASISPTIQSSS